MKHPEKKKNREFGKRRLRIFLAVVLVLCFIVGGTCAVMEMGKFRGRVTVSISDTDISIGNDSISREFGIRGGHVNTTTITNKRIDGGGTIELQEGSEDFVIRLVDEDDPSMELDKTGWKITMKNGDGVEIPQSEAARLIDGATLIHPQIADSDYEKAPFIVDLDLGSERTVSAIGIDKRCGDCDAAKSIDGTMGKYRLYVSQDGINYALAGEGEFREEMYNLHEDAGICLTHFMWEDHIYNMGDRVYANFDRTYTTRYVRLVQETCAAGTTNDSFSSTEITLYEDAYRGTGITDIAKDTITASELIYEGAEAERTDNGKKLTIHYAPLDVNGSTYDIDQIVILGNDDFYLRSFLEIQASDKEKAKIDYIDTNRFVLPENTKDVWDEGMYAIGQPLYAGGLFMGSEFPAVHTWISHENETEIRYYSGKTFARMEADGQLTADGKFVTWQTVIGAAWDTNTKVVQTDFYQYIEEIATPTEFHKQYNSWFDNGMEITDESIKTAFLGVEKGLTQNGIEPLDCYVVDDGWNNYYDGIYQAEPGMAQGTTENATGFWEFNDKFPNEMYTSSALAGRLSSTFGMWLGPQGGYIYDKNFSQMLEASGTGHIRTENTGDGTTASSYLCVASDKYIENLRTFFTDCNTKYDITYWKFDGLGSPCLNPNHGHMTGGYCDMYYISDMWEKWTDLIEDVRAERNAEGRELFINATNGVILSPWILQWVNTVWLNMGSDTGELGTGERHQQKIYYRDQVYYNQFDNERQIQFPLSHVYNHDPIYAVSDGSEAGPEIFREYLFANAVRGTALWEVYFSPSIMEDAYWQIAADVLTWAEDNHEVLKKSQYFGNDPAEGVYGYACFNGNQAVISFTNPLDEVQTYTLKIDGTLGADQNFTGANGFVVYPYGETDLETLGYGDTITVELEPHSTVIRQYGNADDEAPEIVSARSEGADKIIVKLSERVYLDGAAIDGAEVTALLQEDYRTVVLQAEEVLEGSKQVKIRARDMNGNVCEAEEAVLCCGEDNVIAHAAGAGSMKAAEDICATYDDETGMFWMDGIGQKYEVLTDYELIGSGAFTICTGVQTEASGMDLVTAGKDVKLSVDRDGYVTFMVADVTLTSMQSLTTVTQKAYGVYGTDAYVPTQIETVAAGQVNDGAKHTVTAVREANGMLKLYLDGELCASYYNAEKQDAELAGGAITVADGGFEGELAEAVILNKALGYDEISVYGGAVQR